MPFISTKTTCEITKEKETSIKAKLGEAMALIGKSEGWLMLEFEDNKRMYMRGDNKEDIAMVEVALFGKASDSQYDAFTKKITQVIKEELGVDGENIYIKYSEIEHWGYNGFNF